MPTCALTQDLNLDCRDSRGGVYTAYVIEYDNLTAITESAGVVTALTKAAGKYFRKYNLVAHTGEGMEELAASRENGTISVKQTVKFPINKMTTAIRNEILLLAQNRLIWVLVDNNGNAWMYGRKFGMMLTTATPNLGRLLADRNGAELTFESDEPELAVSVQASVVADLQDPGPTPP